MSEPISIVPLYDRVLLRPIEDDAATSGGLLIPDIARQSRLWMYCEVMGIGGGRHNVDGSLIKMKVKVGDVVMVHRKAGTWLPLPTDDGEVEMCVVREPEILAKVLNLPKQSLVLDADGKRLLSMTPNSRAKPDVAYANQDALEVARRAGWTDLQDGEPKSHDGFVDDPE